MNLKQLFVLFISLGTFNYLLHGSPEPVSHSRKRGRYEEIVQRHQSLQARFRVGRMLQHDLVPTATPDEPRAVLGGAAGQYLVAGNSAGVTQMLEPLLLVGEVPKITNTMQYEDINSLLEESLNRWVTFFCDRAGVHTTFVRNQMLALIEEDRHIEFDQCDTYIQNPETVQDYIYNDVVRFFDQSTVFSGATRRKFVVIKYQGVVPEEHAESLAVCTSAGCVLLYPRFFEVAQQDLDLALSEIEKLFWLCKIKAGYMMQALREIAVNYPTVERRNVVHHAMSVIEAAVWRKIVFCVHMRHLDELSHDIQTGIMSLDDAQTFLRQDNFWLHGQPAIYKSELTQWGKLYLARMQQSKK
ncbi:hypothetical protein KBD08_03210 [Candidatus Babeliales bacterium]|nr:hypothetical protein [Candidatus Babeliales bacterium]